MTIKLYKKFVSLTGLETVDFYVVFSAFMPLNKEWLSAYHKHSKPTLETLISEGYIEYYEDVIDGKTVPRYKLTTKGKGLVKNLSSLIENDLVEILDYFNKTKLKILGTKKETKLTRNFRNYVGYWLNEGNTVEDFKLVIDYLFAHWGDDPQMQLYLRPSSMFKKSGPQYFPEKLSQAQDWLDTNQGVANGFSNSSNNYDAYLL